MIIEDLDEQVRTETIRLRDLKEAVIDALNVMCSKRDESMRDIGDRNVQEYNKLEWQFSEILDKIDGMLQEINPEYIELEHSWMSGTAPLKYLMYTARIAGINFIPLQGLSIEEAHRAIEFISSHGLASMNYEATKKALHEFRKYELNERITARLNMRSGC